MAVPRPTGPRSTRRISLKTELKKPHSNRMRKFEDRPSPLNSSSTAAQGEKIAKGTLTEKKPPGFYCRKSVLHAPIGHTEHVEPVVVVLSVATDRRPRAKH